MSWVTRAYRASLVLYPSSFRREYGDEMVALVEDELQFGSAGAFRTGTRLLSDVARTAPRMRLESNMSRVLLIGIAFGVAAISLLIGSPVLVVALAAIALLVYLVVAGRGSDRPIVAPASRTKGWYWWLVAAVGFVFAGFVVAAIDGDEFTSLGWAAFMLSWCVACILGAIGIVLAVTHFVSRRSAGPSIPPNAAA